ncbi:phosphotransferase family protein [Streptomyces sp. NPDC008343]|uniref:phosphotransferase family protein n=1 Tax=Streptomyces sp. NPDC008343 TaxID=3364828 RepID=UPI0036E73BD0
MSDGTVGPEEMGSLLARAGLERDVVRVQPLGGGVSSDVHDVMTTTDRLVVKVALPRLKVAEDWFASVSRAVVERRALGLAGRWTPHHVPEVVGWDDDGLLVLRHLGDDVVPWKPAILASHVHPTTGPELARLLATWQEHGAEGAESLGDQAVQNFDELRTGPFYRTVAARMPDVAAEISHLIQDAAARQECLVHGDYSPKNIMVGTRTVVLDWEVAHLGDPAYDAGFLACHLLLKSIVRPRSEVEAALDGFTTTLDLLRSNLDWERVWRHAGALLLARVVGKSPVDYLSPEQTDRAAALGRALLLSPPETAVPCARLKRGVATSVPDRLDTDRPPA